MRNLFKNFIANESGATVQFTLAVFEPGVGAAPKADRSHG